MKKIFTQESKNPNKEKVVVPSQKTLDFLKQFARAYYVEKSLPNAVNEFCVN